MAEKHKITEELLNALDEYTAACTVVVASANPNVPYGSGVAVKYGNKQYVLTAAHVLANESDDQNIRIMGKADAPLQLLPGKKEFEEAKAKRTYTPAFSSATPISIRNRLGHDGDDIAALEVENLNGHLPHTLLYDLSTQRDAQVTVGEIITIHGFPGDGKALRASNNRAARLVCISTHHNADCQRYIYRSKIHKSEH